MKSRSEIFNFLKNQNLKSLIYPLFFLLIGWINLSCFSSLSAQSIDKATEKLQKIHSQLNFMYGSLSEEYPEQLMAAMYVKRNAKVLELGGNCGRNSCVIASILNNSSNLVVVEAHPGYARLLQENRDLNNFNFHIEEGAVSKVSLVQLGGKTIPSEVEIPGYTKVNTISFNEVQKKYKIKFDTLVVDCEGALYYILMDDPKLLRNIETVIIENDFDNLDHMLFVQERFKENGLQLVYNQAGGGGPCYNYFYQVWQKSAR